MTASSAIHGVAYEALLSARDNYTRDTGYPPNVKIRCGDGTVDVHLKILPENTKQFEVHLLEDAAMRVYTGNLDTLREKNPPAVVRILLFFYTSDYPATGGDLADDLWAHITVFALADSLGLGTLRDLAIAKFQAVAVWNCAEFVEIVDLDFSLPSSVEDFRSTVLTICQPHYLEIAQTADWNYVLETHGRFTASLLHTSVERNDNLIAVNLELARLLLAANNLLEGERSTTQEPATAPDS